MDQYIVERQYADFSKVKPIIKVIHRSDCILLKNIHKNTKEGPFSTFEDAQAHARKIFPEIPIRRCGKCF